jgi:hypothetical protein
MEGIAQVRFWFVGVGWRELLDFGLHCTSPEIDSLR